MVRENYDSKKKTILLDTQGVLDLYQEKGIGFFDYLKDANYVIPGAVLFELENQNKERRKGDDQRTLCPGQLIGYIYSLIGEQKIEVLYPNVDTDGFERVSNALIKGSGEKNNQRLGKGDLEIILATEELTAEGEVVSILTEDTDINYILDGMEIKNVEVINAGRYLQMT